VIQPILVVWFVVVTPAGRRRAACGSLTDVTVFCDNGAMRIGIVTMCIVVMAGGCRQVESVGQPDFAPGRPHLSVVTYNVNYGVARPENVIRYLADSNASVICLQETHARWEGILRPALEQRYPHSYFQEWQAAGGIALMSRYELGPVRVIQPEVGWWPALLAEVETPAGAIQILNVHLKPPLTERGSVTVPAYCQAPGIHRKELAGFLRHVDPERPLIIAGDFNESEIGLAMRSLFDQGFASALSAYDRRSKTWHWKVWPGIVVNDRYDHILYSDHLHCTGAEVVHVSGSDHLPVRAVMVPKEPIVAAMDSAKGE
jgi:endonuclease/exonuclease/phosphatase family metal-dependent hydrolase